MISPAGKSLLDFGTGDMSCSTEPFAIAGSDWVECFVYPFATVGVEYVAGDALGGSFELPAVVATNGGSAVMRGFLLACAGPVCPTGKLVIFSDAPTAATIVDHTPFVYSTADALQEAALDVTADMWQLDRPGALWPYHCVANLDRTMTSLSTKSLWAAFYLDRAITFTRPHDFWATVIFKR
jgi:hypothetical protein